ncbi:DUF2569 domain-containing protein [Pseudomonas brenneri]|uniref:DUF2569 domain-containing protein n=1 Tax=Pseudomonas brenneri TaxID=129817 RepID=UPI0028D8D9BD|nr:DUF2569 domain-containing protein [Pseudomonas brenneri]|tara:strand:+ start:343 stop:840 length:498 start_codon:yes stop_codon:yes gene_type:complete
MNEKDRLNGLKGWLLLVMVGLFISPLRIIYEVFPAYYSFFMTEGVFEYVTTPGTEGYLPYFLTFLVSEMLFNTLLVLAYAYLLYLFFIKSYLFPQLFIVVIFASVIFIPLDAWLGSFFDSSISIDNPEIKKEMIGSLISACIWVPYMVVSKRVRATFGVGESNKD